MPRPAVASGVRTAATLLVAALVLVATAASTVLLLPPGRAAADTTGLRWAYQAFASTQQLDADGGEATIAFPIPDPASYGVDLAQGFEVWYTNGTAETDHVESTLTGPYERGSIWSATVTFPSGGLGTWTLHTGVMVDTQGYQADPVTWDNDGTATVRVGFPSPPTSVDAVATGQGHVLHLSWPPADDGGSPITAYQVYAGNDLVGTTSPDDPELDVDVAAEATNTFTVLSVNAAGTSSASPFSPRTPAPADAPAAPTLWGAYPGDGSADVLVLRPDDMLTAAVTRIVVTASPGGATCVADVYRCTIEGLQPGTEYTLTARSENAVGSSGPSTPVSVTTYSLPKAPTTITVTRPTGSSALLQWDASAPTGATSWVSYSVSSVPASGTCSGWSTSCTIDGLVTGQQYRFFVVAHNDVGDSTPSDAVALTGYARPGAPRSLLVACRVDGADLSWSPGVTNGSSTAEFTVLARSDLGSARTVHVLPAHRSARLSGLTPGTTWHFTLAQVNAAGAGPGTTGRSCVLPDPRLHPLRTAAPVVQATSAHAISVHWSQRNPTDRLRVDRAEVLVRHGDRTVARILLDAGTSTEALTQLSTTIRHLSSRTRYSIAVRGHNAAGWSAFSPAASVTTRRG